MIFTHKPKFEIPILHYTTETAECKATAAKI